LVSAADVVGELGFWYVLSFSDPVSLMSGTE
jgi:hypothetical protein